MKKTVVTLMFCGLAILAGAQKGHMFPSTSGKTLDDKRADIPTKNNKISVIGIAYNRAAEDELKKWLNPMYSTFVKKTSDNSSTFDMAEIYDVNFYFIPLISGLKKAAADFKAGTDKEFWPYILDTDLNIKSVKEQLKIEDDKIPYFYVLDKNGKIIEAVNGKYTEEKMNKLEEAADQ